MGNITALQDSHTAPPCRTMDPLTRESHNDELNTEGPERQEVSAMWRHDITAWSAYLRATGYPQTTIDLRTYHLSRLAKAFPDGAASLTFDELVEWLASYNWGPNTRRAYRGSLRAFYRWALATGRVDEDPAALLPPVRVPRAQPRPAPEAAWQEVRTITDERVRIAILLAGACGLRRGEICKVHTHDVEQVASGYSLRVEGKGGHMRMVPLPNDLARLLLNRPEGWVFPSQRGDHVQPHWLGKIVRRELPGDLTTHTLRHRCASVAYAATKDIRAVQELLGHASIQTTQLYTATPDDSIRAAMMAAAA